jgi:hypothetical protein
MFSQILQLFPRSDFQLLVKETKAERHARGFSCWNQFVAMMFCQLGARLSFALSNSLIPCDLAVHSGRFFVDCFNRTQVGV